MRRAAAAACARASASCACAGRAGVVGVARGLRRRAAAAAMAAGGSQRVAVMGDLHLSREIMDEYFAPAREDIARALGGSDGGGFVVQVRRRRPAPSSIVCVPP